jgi:uncharacterized protein (DUF2062 family)
MSEVKPERPVGRRRRIGRAYSEMHYQLRTEGDTPGRKAVSVALGVGLGCLPVWGLHLLLCASLARLLRVSRVRTYLAAHINNPITFPFLLYFELGIGRWLRSGDWPTIDRRALGELGAAALGDLMLGAVVLGVGLGAIAAVVAYSVSYVYRLSPFFVKLVEEASRPYVKAGVTDWEFVRWKLRKDPMYSRVLEWGLLPSSGRLVDLGCGRGILLALVLAARRWPPAEPWAAGWAAPPRDLELVGVDFRPHAVETVRVALGNEVAVELADLVDYRPPPCRAAVLLDVLHYMAAGDQERLVERTAAALEPGGLLLIREAAAALGWRFWLTRAGERTMSILRGDFRRRFCYRDLRSWRSLLERHDLEVRATPMRAGTPYANVLLEARKAPGPGG